MNEWIYWAMELWLVAVPFAAFGLCVLCHSLTLRIRRRCAEAAELEELRQEKRQAARQKFTIPMTPDPYAYSREAWLRDMENPDLSIEEITARVVLSKGSWRVEIQAAPKEAPPANPSIASAPLAPDGLGSLSGFLGACAVIAAGSLLGPSLSALWAASKK